MWNKEKKLVLEDTLNQIYNNDYLFDSDITDFFFQNAQFIALNDTCMHIPKHTCLKITLFAEHMIIKIADMIWRIRYMSINNFSIHFEE